MFDPAALGTLLIGLEANRAAEAGPGTRQRRRPPRSERAAGAVRLAEALRRLADRLDRRPVTAEAPC